MATASGSSAFRLCHRSLRLSNSCLLLSLFIILAASTAWLGLLVAEQSALISTQDAMLNEFRGSKPGTVTLHEVSRTRIKRRDKLSTESSLSIASSRQQQRAIQQQRQRLPTQKKHISMVNPNDSPFKLQHLYKDPMGRPRLESLISSQDHSITSDVSWLLQIAIIGFGKCGTTTLMHWLHSHPQITCLLQEVWVLMHGRPGELVRHLYLGLPPHSNQSTAPLQRCYKCPGDIMERHILEYYRQYWPQTKLLIGIRHPYEWFTSLYNFRIQNLPLDQKMKHPNDLIGRCVAGMFLTCTEKGNYAYHLLKLGKQNLLPVESLADESARQRRKELEDEIVGTYRSSWYNVSAIEPIPNPVFLFDMHQLDEATMDDASNSNSTDTNAVASTTDNEATFRRDMQVFLNLSSSLPPVPHFRPGREILDNQLQKDRDALKIKDICDPEYLPVRTELLRLARVNSEWIRTVFVHLPTVHVSNPKRFDELLLRWMDDPCDRKT